MSPIRNIFSPLREFARFILSVLTLGLFALLPLLCHAEDPLATKVKAAYVYHLLNYIEWSVLPDDALRICVLGNETLGSMLRDLSDRQVKNLPLNVVTDNQEQLNNCQVVFISEQLSDWLSILAKLPDTGVLTVGDPSHFAAQGGIVGFYTLEGKIKLELNPVAAQRAQLKISSKLLELAKIVSSP